MKIKDKWNKSWSYAVKLKIIMMIVILTMSTAAILASTISSLVFLTRQNEQYAAEQLSAMAVEYESTLEQYKSVIFSLVMDKHIQKYCSFTQTDSHVNEEAGNVYDTLLNILYMQNNANFMAIVSYNLDTYTYNGNISIFESRFDTVWTNDYAASIPAKEKGTLRMSFSDRYSHNDTYTLTLYLPVYSTTNMVTENGMVVINLEDSLLKHLNDRTHYIYSNPYLTDQSGRIVSNTDVGTIGNQVAFADRLIGNRGSFHCNGGLVNYQKVGEWNLYLINEIPAIYLYRNCFGIILVLLTVMLVLMVIFLFISGRMAKSLYRPIHKVVSKMNVVSSGNLRTRINTADMDCDSLKLADGFNSMMDEIDILIARVADEQRQVAQMRFNMLQAQIQPHFLYNTLECIHWQALSGCTRDVSTMAKALAQYYRVCLSSGKDIISLKKELEHIHNYLIIQNMRYDDIIRLDVQVDDKYMDMQIPKITLQPLVENSIYHGIRIKEGRKGVITVSIREQHGKLLLSVEDNGQGMTQQQIDFINQHITDFNAEIGYGVNNVNKRIELLYGSEYGLHYRPGADGGVCVDIHLPQSELCKNPGQERQDAPCTEL